MMKTYKLPKNQKDVVGSENVHNNFHESGTVCGAKGQWNVPFFYFVGKT